MARIDVARRFASAMAERNNWQSVSLPVLCGGTEILFFYEAESHSAGTVLRRLGRIYLREPDASGLTIRDALDYFQADALQQLLHSPPFPLVHHAYILAEQYYALHEELLQAAEGELSSEGRLTAEYLRLFSKIVPPGPLRTVYQRIGGPLFQTLPGPSSPDGL